MDFVACDLDKMKLPTNRDVIQYLLFLRNEKMRQGFKGNVGFDDLIPRVVKEIRELWKQTNIPISTYSPNRQKMLKLVQTYRELVRTPTEFDTDEWGKLFMICQCLCGTEINLPCMCIASLKIPHDAYEFYIDQCGPRLLTLELFRVGADGGNGDDMMGPWVFGKANKGGKAKYK